MKQDINIDALMADAWLTVTELRFGARLADGEGDRLWRHCVDHIEQVMAKLEAAEAAKLQSAVADIQRRCPGARPHE
ncbi:MULTISPECIES: hypothetical protein [Enterobacteriaceae]|uniref:hypothetical protein n=1 Tax=Enterobacteriaceae TaxID=543 RepID=UPI0007CC9749|nr:MULTISPECIES: hypothetical protein [Klebsiella]MDU7170925.1 hypothetical protein [Klebsiella sp.]MDU7677245.1 hypothetical protein [Klebsiella michiganensis]MEB6469816.1 hypothetical protein [Klebsiella michiganensis]SAQ05979.1 putative OmpA-family membrane protein [Klebsiella michiganensis]